MSIRNLDKMFQPRSVAVIVRDWYDIRAYHLTDEGACAFCGHRLAGRYGKFGKPFGPRRIPVRLALGV